MSIYVMTPFCQTGEGVEVLRPYDGRPVGYNIVSAYRRYFALLGPDDWMVAMDHDIALVTRGWMKTVEAAIAQEPTGTFVAVTNRLLREKAAWQMGDLRDEWEPDLLHHFHRADQMQEQHGTKLRDVTAIEDTGLKPLSAVFLVISKDTWDAIGEIPINTYAVDWTIHRRIRDIGRKVFLMQGLYCLHFSGYREKYLNQPRYPDPPKRPPRSKPAGTK